MILTLITTLALVAAVGGSPSVEDFPRIEGWTPSSEVRTQEPENLWELIDGAAEQFLSYGFARLESRELSSGDLTVTVDIYDMATPLNAFGIYTVQRPAAREKLAIGTEAVISPPYQCLLLKDRFFVTVEAYRGEIDETTGKTLLESIAGSLPGTSAFPPELELLPREGRVPGSEGFVREGFLGLADLANCVYADYLRNDGVREQAFAVIPPAGATAQSIWEKLAVKWQRPADGEHQILSREIPYKGLAGVMLTDRGIVGVSGAADESQLIERLRSTFAHVRSRTEGR